MPQQKNMLVYAETNTDRPKITANDIAGACAHAPDGKKINDVCRQPMTDKMGGEFSSIIMV